MRIALLTDRHAGETATIVGRGPSLLRLWGEDFEPGPVIVLNAAIRVTRELHLPNPVYSMQKDGCGILRRHRCATGPRMTQPEPPEVLIVHSREAPRCFVDYSPRYEFDNPVDFGLNPRSPSSPSAVAIAALMGCKRIVLLAHDASTTGDTRLVRDGRIVRGVEAYRNHRDRNEAVAEARSVRLIWR